MHFVNKVIFWLRPVAHAVTHRAPKKVALKSMLSDEQIKSWRARPCITFPSNVDVKFGHKLDQFDLDSLLCEAHLRCTAGRVLVAPAQLAQLLLLATTEGELDNAKKEFQRYLERSDVLLIPLNVLDAARWVLIALEAANANVPVSSRRALQMCRVEAEQAVREALYPLGAFEPVSRDDGERWIVRYYDSLKEPSVTCALQADKLLTLLSLPTRPLECTNAAKQGDGRSCGYWVGFFAEEEMRRYCQEGMWTQRMSTTGTALYEYTNMVRDKFRSARTAAELQWQGEIDFKG